MKNCMRSSTYTEKDRRRAAKANEEMIQKSFQIILQDVK